MEVIVGSGGRRAPYAPVSALREFLGKIGERSVPPRVDRQYLRKLGIASNNEWALLSALKFLGIVDPQGVPTPAFRRLQRSNQREEALRHLVETSYADLLASGGARMTPEDLENYFRVTSSASQARNAARFFRELSRMAKLPAEGTRSEIDSPALAEAPRPEPLRPEQPPGLVLAAKARLLEKLPAPRAEWSAADYQAICDRFIEMLRHLDDAR